ncbi:hypothetical protein B0T22DRAFT_287907 [Podospora appendiculata]|uniref:F-box domain-containing protein n=1 Tax=Podospora appendiculata TaxID=314037 RepID=A0AAE0X168_9PEZI|nr:hypothetical protein B0T22DRAFT_287907 [Podospora appendiculata]
MSQTLADLPDDVLLLVLASLESARDLSALALSCHRLNHLVATEGWRVFVRSRFPSLVVPIPSSGSAGWRNLAESLTWQSRCWDKRALQFNALLPRPGPGREHQRRREAPFQPVIDAHYDPETQQEIVVWGAGENIVARYRDRKVSDQAAKTSWYRSDGKDHGFTAGYDDVRAISIVKDRHQSGRAILAGRDNGELALLSAEPDRFGERLTQFRPAPAVEHDSRNGSPGQSRTQDRQETINSLDVLYTGSQSLIAAATKTSVMVYKLPEDDASEAAPLATLDLRRKVFESKATQLCHAKWMGQGEVVALALKGCKDPLRYLSISPSGEWTQQAAFKNLEIENQFNIGYGNICPSSLQPVQPHAGSKGGTNLLLSAWRDGTCRLQDLRTSSPFDAVYQDNVDPWADMETLMTYGTERFIGGGMNGAAIKIFDFRWTKDYYHTTGLPCMDRVPFSQPPQPFLKAPQIDRSAGRARCNHLLVLRCRWHDLSRHIYYRPNVTFFLTKALPHRYSSSGIWSLAKPSDISPNFYIGITGGIIEASLEPFGDDKASGMMNNDLNSVFNGLHISSGVAPSANTAYTSVSSSESARASEYAGYDSRPLGASMMETGDGYAFRQNDRAIRFPYLWQPRAREVKVDSCDPLMSHHRLDSQYQFPEDYLPEV